jgi:hypothetical protein
MLRTLTDLRDAVSPDDRRTRRRKDYAFIPGLEMGAWKWALAASR